MSDKPKTVTMTALECHTYNGKEYDAGATYEAAEGDAESIESQGKATRAAAAKPAHGKAPSQPVKPMTTADVPAGKPPAKK